MIGKLLRIDYMPWQGVGVVVKKIDGQGALYNSFVCRWSGVQEGSAELAKTILANEISIDDCSVEELMILRERMEE